jgi:hypothetical protein
MTGTLVNVLAVIVGSLVGLFFKRRLPEQIVKSVFQAIGLFTLFLGVAMALKAEHILVVVFSLIVGTITGEWLLIEKRMEQLTHWIKEKLKLGDPKFSEGLITSFLLFCMGSMTILGAVNEGMGQGSELLYTKSLMDGFSSIALAAAFGLGVTFSVVPLFLFQGGITLLAWWLGNFIPEVAIANLSSVGGIVLLGLGINILELQRIRIMNMLPALLWVIPLTWLYGIYIP